MEPLEAGEIVRWRAREGWSAVGVGLAYALMYYVAIMVAGCMTPVLLVGAACRFIEFRDIPPFWVWCLRFGFLEKP